MDVEMSHYNVITNDRPVNDVRVLLYCEGYNLSQAEYHLLAMQTHIPEFPRRLRHNANGSCTELHLVESRFSLSPYSKSLLAQR